RRFSVVCLGSVQLEEIDRVDVTVLVARLRIELDLRRRWLDPGVVLRPGGEKEVDARVEGQPGEHALKGARQCREAGATSDFANVAFGFVQREADVERADVRERGRVLAERLELTDVGDRAELELA